MSVSPLALLGARADAGRPLRVGLIGVDAHGALFLAQARRVPGLHVLGVADAAPERARATLLQVGWPEERFGAESLGGALASGATHVGDDAAALVAAHGLDIIIEASDSPAAGIAHTLLALDYGRHVIMANLAADALAGPILARRAAAAGVIYSLGYGATPALLAEQVAWARSCGLTVVCAGASAPHVPPHHIATPDAALAQQDLAPELAAQDEQTRRVAAIDETRLALTMASAANACELDPQPDGLRFPPCGVEHLAATCKPERDGGSLAFSGTLEVVSSLRRDGSPVPGDLGGGVFVTVAAPDAYLARRLAEAGLRVDSSGRYAALYRPHALAGAELLISVLRVGLRGEATGLPLSWRGDAVALARRDIEAGEQIEVGANISGALRPASASLSGGLLPVGLAQSLAMRRAVSAGAAVTWDDVEYEPTNPTVRMRKLMERTFAGAARERA
jgi:predicted homoserine dehydrogenase-like protein